MKILMVLDREFPPDVRVENEIEALTEAGHEIFLASYTRKDGISKENFNNAVIYRKPISKFYYKSSVGCLKFPFYFNFWKRYINKLFKENNFDAIHIHDLPLAAVGLYFKKKYNIKLTIDLHENWPALLEMSAHTNTFLGKLLSSNAQWKRYEKKMLDKADKVVVVVDEAKQRLINDLNIDENKIHIVSNTLNIGKFNVNENNIDKDYFTLVYAGGINKHRGIQNIIKAFPEIVKAIPNIRLWVIGAGSYVDELKKLTNDLELNLNIKFWGWKSVDEMAELIAQSDLTLIPHLKSDHTDSTIPHKLFQYMYLNKAVLSSDCAPIKRILLETNSGLTFKDRDIEDIENQIINLYNNKDLFEKLKSNGKNWVLKKYNWNVDKMNLCDLYSVLDN